MAWQDRAYNKGGDGTLPLSFRAPITGLSVALILVCLLVFLLQSLTGPSAGASWLVGRFGLSKLAVVQPWRWITYQYLHKDGWHIVFNCVGIFFFVPPLERRWGWRLTLAFYTAGGIFAGLVYVLLSVAFPGIAGVLIGASGAILAALGACALLFPDMQLILLVFPVPIRLAAALFAIAYFLLVVGDRRWADAVHLTGMGFGLIAPWWGGRLWHKVTRYRIKRRLVHESQSEKIEQEAVDRILQKVHDSGMRSLNWRERRILRKATERQRQRDLEFSRRRG